MIKFFLLVDVFELQCVTFLDKLSNARPTIGLLLFYNLLTRVSM
jgi:hypothetical protein